MLQFQVGHGELGTNTGGKPLKTNSLPLKIGHHKRKRSYSNHPFSGAMLVSGKVRVIVVFTKCIVGQCCTR